jgi:hypothetical protein
MIKKLLSTIQEVIFKIKEREKRNFRRNIGLQGFINTRERKKERKKERDIERKIDR